MYNFQRNDEKFNLDNVTNEEIFNGLKPAIVTTLKTQKKFSGAQSIFVFLEDLHSYRENSYGEDWNLYPKISLGSKVIITGEYQPVDVQVLVKPFDVELLICDGKITSVKSEELSNALTRFITTKFPNSDYQEKKAEYQKMAEIRKRTYDQMGSFQK